MGTHDFPDLHISPLLEDLYVGLAQKQCLFNTKPNIVKSQVNINHNLRNGQRGPLAGEAKLLWPYVCLLPFRIIVIYKVIIEKNKGRLIVIYYKIFN